MTVDDIVIHITQNFRTFGVGSRIDMTNPLSQLCKDMPTTFACDVKVRDVVEFVLACSVCNPVEHARQSNES